MPRTILKPSGHVRFAWSASLSSEGQNSASVEFQCVTIRGVISATGTEFVVVQFVVASYSDAWTFIKCDLNSLKFRGRARLWPPRHCGDHILSAVSNSAKEPLVCVFFFDTLA